MRKNQMTGAILASAAAALIAALQLTAMPAASAADANGAQRTADGKADLSGIWQTLNTANWDIQEHAAHPGPVVALGAAGAEPAGLGVVEAARFPTFRKRLRKRR
jgi:hypothetical protein